MVFLTVKFYGWEIGHYTFLNSFFYTVAHHLEKRDWGSRFPVVMNEFYEGELSVEHIGQARKEMKEIQEELSELPPSAIVWDINDLSIKPPWGDALAEDITNMGNYFRTSDGAEDLFEVFEKAFKESLEEKVPVRIKNI